MKMNLKMECFQIKTQHINSFIDAKRCSVCVRLTGDVHYDGIHNVEQYLIPNQVNIDGSSYLLLASHPNLNRIAFVD